MHKDLMLQVNGSVEIAPARNPEKHILRWNPELSPEKYLDHICLHEIGHIERAWPAIQRGEYRIIYSNSKTAENPLKEIEKELDQIHAIYHLSDHLKRQFIEMLYNGLIMQLASQPVDIRIEDTIFKKYPNHRQLQHSYLMAEHKKLIKITNPEMRARLPSKMTLRSMAMNNAYTKGISIALSEPAFSFDGLTEEEYEIGERLYQFYADTPDLDYTQEMDLINNWANILDISDWYEWKKPSELAYSSK